MFSGKPRDPSQERRRGASLILVLVTLPVMLGMAALAVDVGAMYNTRTDLQRTADAAALAGASAYITDTMMLIRQGTESSTLITEIDYLASSRAAGTSRLNPTFGTETTALGVGDVQTGWIDVTSATSPITKLGVAAGNHNAVQVTVRRSDEGANGPLELFFSGIFGVYNTNVSASATAVFDDRVSGFDVGDSGGALLPFTIHKDVYENELATGGDVYGYDQLMETVTDGADGVGEINLYPYDATPGNFGLLNLPSTSGSDAATHKDQIENGVLPEDIEPDVGGPEFTFYDADGGPITYILNGNPGIEVALKDSLDLRIGDVIGFLLHDQATDTGSNTDYHIVGIRFGRLMGHRLTGGPVHQGVWIQPAVYAGNGVRVDKDAPSSGGMMGRLVLVR